MTEHFQLEPTPPDPQQVKVYQIGNATWWAGYSLQQCIDAAHSEDGKDEMEYETESRECTAEEMQSLTFTDGRTFAAELQRRIDAGEQFPQLFACTEY